MNCPVAVPAVNAVFPCSSPFRDARCSLWTLKTEHPPLEASPSWLPLVGLLAEQLPGLLCALQQASLCVKLRPIVA